MPLPANTYEAVDVKSMSAIVAAAFSQRRKTIRNALQNVADSEQLEAAGIDPGLRAEAIPIECYVALTKLLNDPAIAGQL